MTALSAPAVQKPVVPAARPARVDIQALRALAVALVVVYHFWPARLGGGFVGVDVFFVISGFLITSHLLSKPPTTGRGLTEFWGRRIRRLLPAAGTVLLITLLGTAIFAPTTLWQSTGLQSVFAGLYIENWFLAGQSVDYLAADAPPTPVQHYWSLSIEEQFYLVWPVLFFLVWMLVRARPRRAIGIVLSLVVGASLLASVVGVVVDPAASYFVTWTRAWELGAGGLLAFAAPWLAERMRARPGAAALLAWAGFLVILASAVLITPAMPFPGWIALAPVAGTLMVIAASDPAGRRSPAPIARLRGVQTLGDISYSVYLWHWPAVVLVPYALGREMNWFDKAIAIAVVVLLSLATKRWIEDRFRGRKPLGTPLRRSYIAMVAIMAVVAASGLSLAGVAAAEERRTAAQIQQGLDAELDCFGAAAMRDAGCEPAGDELYTSPVFAAGDKPAAYEDDCWVLGDLSGWKTCHYGSDDPEATRVALVGNSHAGHWLPALQQLADEENWSITTYLISVCYTVEVPIGMPTAEQRENCGEWNARAIDEIAAGGYDLIVTSNRTSMPLAGMSYEETQSAARTPYRDVLAQWAASDTPVLVMRDTPVPQVTTVPDCVAAADDALDACESTMASIPVDPMADAVEELGSPDVEVLDLTHRFCADGVCRSIIGGVIAYFDQNHMTETFAATLAPDILPAAQELIALGRDE
ncbi:acyltransferase family protein [Agromyces archimandritae]|uniref:Acyltransferase n=1 Tax=Agromyces archimandritae TaxID=2781962 RepID=A0A975FN97_9MICO|nr:acyltransferase family protein [Agromyces archimandritae]QTX05259.1 acyltransferase [Agromyces archimandritae]